MFLKMVARAALLAATCPDATCVTNQHLLLSVCLCRTNQNWLVVVDPYGSLNIGSGQAGITWTSARPVVTARSGAKFWAFVAPDGGIYVVYGLTWNEPASRIVLACNAQSAAGTCTVIPPTMPAADYTALHTRVFRNIKTTGDPSCVDILTIPCPSKFVTAEQQHCWRVPLPKTELVLLAIACLLTGVGRGIGTQRTAEIST